MEARNFRCEANLQEVQLKVAGTTADAENVAFPADGSQYTGAARCLLSAVRGRKLLKSRGVHSSHTRHHFFFP